MTDSPSSVSQKPIIYPLPSILDPIDLSALFPNGNQIEVELGSGDGSFLVDYATAHPEKNFIGIERLFGRLRKIERKSRRRELSNVRAIRIECGYFTRYLLSNNSVSAIHVYFPDPWPKRKHRQNRLINASFPSMAHKKLTCGGQVFLRTDDQDYFAQMREVFEKSALFVEIETPVDLQSFKTDFERDFNAKGIPTNLAAFKTLASG